MSTLRGRVVLRNTCHDYEWLQERLRVMQRVLGLLELRQVAKSGFLAHILLTSEINQAP